MSKDKDTKRRITIMERRTFTAVSEDEIDCWIMIGQSFLTTELAKTWLREHGESDKEYLIVRATANVTMQQKTVNKLIPVQSE